MSARIISFGGGVDSTAMVVKGVMDGLLDGMEIVYVDTKSDWPHTYTAMDKLQLWLRERGHRPITVLRPKLRVKRGVYVDSLYDWFAYYRMVPVTTCRICTWVGKIEPLLEYVGDYEEQWIGLNAGETRRIRRRVKQDGDRYPLVEWGLDREGCKEVIASGGLEVPRRSHCYFCPHQSVEDWRRLKADHPLLFQKVREMEKDNRDYQIERERVPRSLANIGWNLDKIVEPGFLEYVQSVAPGNGNKNNT